MSLSLHSQTKKRITDLSFCGGKSSLEVAALAGKIDDEKIISKTILQFEKQPLPLHSLTERGQQKSNNKFLK